MKPNFSRLKAIFALLLMPLFMFASELSRINEQLIDSLELRLEEINNPDDSIKTLLNIYDLCPSSAKRISTLKRLIHTTRHSFTNTRSEVLTYAANEMRDSDSLLNIVETEMLALPEGTRKKEALLFLDMVKTDRHIKNATPEQAGHHLSEIMKKYDANIIQDPYEEARLLYSLCKHMGISTKGELLESYIAKLQDLVESMDLPSGSVRNFVYNRAAPIFARNGSAKKAIEIDKKMLNIIDSLAMSYKAQGRQFRNMNPYKYAIFRRMLINYKELTPQEIEMFYNAAIDLGEKDVRVAADLRLNNSIEICHSLANKDYARAIKLIKDQKPGSYQKDYHIYFLKALVDAAKAIGDRTTQLEAALELNDSLQRRIENKADERYREMQILYDMADLRRANDKLLRGEHNSHLKMTKTILAFAVVSLILLGILALILFRNYRKMRKLAAMHFETSTRLRDERNELYKVQKELIEARDKAKDADKIKTEFINNMSHEVKAPLDAILEYAQLIMDCIPLEQQRYLERYANTMKQNAKLVLTLLNDVLDMASLEHGHIAISKKPESIQDICWLAIDNIFDNSRDELKVVFNPSEKKDALASIDKVRVCQVLMNLLSNAEKFTESGTITLDYDINRNANKVTFTITDTGIGVADGCEDLIFTRFYKINPSTKGCGLGLYISRLLAGLMQGEVKLDKNYHNGSRFIFSIPL